MSSTIIQDLKAMTLEAYRLLGIHGDNEETNMEAWQAARKLIKQLGGPKIYIQICRESGL